MMTWISCSLVREPSKRRHANEIGEPENKSAYIRFQFFSFFRPRRKGERERELVSLTLALLTGRRREILVKRMLDWCLKHTDTVAVFFFFLWHYLRLIYVSSLIFVLSLPPLLIVSYYKSAVSSRVLQMEILKGAELTRNLWTTKLGKK